MKSHLPTVSFDPDEQILFVKFASAKIETKEDIETHFQTIERFWRRDCGGKKVYAVIDYTNFSIDIALTDAWAAAVKRAVETQTLVALRVTTDLSAKTALRAVAVKIHHPSNVYATREDAIAVIRGLRTDQVKLKTD